jgi:hypothetical protein
MVSSEHTAPPTIGEVERMSQTYTARAIREEDLAQALYHQGHQQASDNNNARARYHRRTAHILKTYARELDARSAQVSADPMAAE